MYLSDMHRYAHSKFIRKYPTHAGRQRRHVYTVTNTNMINMQRMYAHMYKDGKREGEREEGRVRVGRERE